MFKRKKKTGCETPTFSKPTVPPQSNVPTMPTTTKPPNVGSSVQRPHQPCQYETPCGWCSKWDKKCDNKVGCVDDTEPSKKKDAALEWIKSGRGLPPLDTNLDHNNLPSGIRKEF